MNVPNVRQRRSEDCGPAIAYAIMLAFFSYTDVLAKLWNKDGTTPQQLINFFKSINLKYQAIEPISISKLRKLVSKNDTLVACSIKVDEVGHWVIVYKVSATHVYFHDPIRGKRKQTIEKFFLNWRSTDKDGIIYIRYGIAVRKK